MEEGKCDCPSRESLRFRTPPGRIRKIGEWKKRGTEERRLQKNNNYYIKLK